MNRRSRGLIIAAAAATLLIGVVIAGSLDPPSPPSATPGPEPRTPIGSLPFTISQPGSYYLAGDLTGSAGAIGISIESSDVTIDFRGFTLRGVPGPGAAILAGANQNLRLLNGTIRDWGGDGLYLPGAFDVTIEGMHVTGCAGSGMVLYNTVQIRDCVLDGNGQWGISAGVGTIISGCSVRGNGSQAGGHGGISVGDAGQVSECNLYLNRGTSVQTGVGCQVTGCSINSTLVSDLGTDGTGIAAGAETTVRGNTIVDSRRAIMAGLFGSIEDNHITRCTEFGIELAGSANIRGNTVSNLPSPASAILSLANSAITDNSLINCNASTLLNQGTIYIQNREIRCRGGGSGGVNLEGSEIRPSTEATHNLSVWNAVVSVLD